MIVLLFVALWFILRGDLFYVLPCVILFFCFSVVLALRLPRLGKRELILVLFVRLFALCLFGCLVLSVSSSYWCMGAEGRGWGGGGCGLWLLRSLDFSLNFVFIFINENICCRYSLECLWDTFLILISSYEYVFIEKEEKHHYFTVEKQVLCLE